MRVLITGNMGYVGSVLVTHLRQIHPEWELIGLDPGWFAGCLLDPLDVPERFLDKQYFLTLSAERYYALPAADAVVYLAAISNDPMSEKYSEETWETNRAAAETFDRARALGAKSFVFASTCSVYGFSPDMVDEDSNPHPQTVYAQSKLAAEAELLRAAPPGFPLTIFRFATACGPSPRPRLDLVLNDFVASVITSGKVKLLSDGAATRPLIDVRDMARAIEHAILRKDGPVVVNAGAANYKISDLARLATILPPQIGEVHDTRSYRVNFDRYLKLGFPAPLYDAAASARDLEANLAQVGWCDFFYRKGIFNRLATLERLRSK
jgi:nucleoside-diphosphate-sugar epimerase